jgi:hypothetical protein
MQLRTILILFFFSILISNHAFAQQTSVPKDSTHLYKNIETFSKRGKFTKFIYGLLFKPVAGNQSNKKARRKVYKKLIQKPYSSFEGKTIRYIKIETLDPFGYTLGDSIVSSQNFVTKTGNNLHVKSQPIAIRNLLLIRQNQPFDSLLVKESERLVRSMQYIRDVSFYVKSTAENSDSVDVTIRALDIWSIIPRGSISTSSTTIDLTDKNFLGLGHEFQNAYTRNYTDESNYLNLNYSIPNIVNTYIHTTLHYDILGDKKSARSINIERPFFSPFAKWAAGAFFVQQFRLDSIKNGNLLFVPQRFKFNAQDFWAGNAFPVLKGNTESHRTTNFISTVRFLRIRYLEKPTAIVDPLNMFSNENLYLASVGISARKYVQDKYIYKFGYTEDIPIGKVISITGGYQKRDSIGRIYLGGRISLGNYYTWGYLGSSFEYGTFFRSSKAEQGVLSVSASYFTGLLEIGKWKFRQFVKPEVTIGLNRFSYDSLTINQGYGLDGFNSLGLSGTRRLLFTLQTQAYAPWNFIGFRFGPFLTYSFGMLGDASSGFKNSKIYSQIGLGVLIKNENLVLNAFQVSISFFPIIPGNGSNIFKTNSFRTSDFGFRDFEIGKPGIVLYQ